VPFRKLLAGAAEVQLFEKNGARVLLGAKSVLRLNGTELDYKDKLMHSECVKKDDSPFD
jgi:Fe-S cluster assembly iron-binding protein IscA